MSRKDDDKDDNVTVLHPHGKPPPVDTGSALLPCRWCQTPTQRATLAHYGARCLRCYEAYCCEPGPKAKPPRPRQAVRPVHGSSPGSPEEQP